MKKIIRKILKENRVNRFLDYIVDKLLSETEIYAELNRCNKHDVYIRFPWTTSERRSSWIDRTNLISFSTSFRWYVEVQYGIDFNDKLSKMIWDSYYSDALKQVIDLEESAPGFNEEINEAIIHSANENETTKKILQHLKKITEFDTEETKFKNYRKSFFRSPFTGYEWYRGVSKWGLETHFYDYLKSVFGFKINYIARVIYDEYYAWLSDTLSQLEDGYDEPDPNYISESNDKYVKFVDFITDQLLSTVKVIAYNVDGDGDILIRLLNGVVVEENYEDGEMDFWVHESLLTRSFNTIHKKELYRIDKLLCDYLERFGVRKDDEINHIWDRFRAKLKEKYPRYKNPLEKGSVNESKDVAFGIMEELYDSVMGDLMSRTYIKQNNGHDVSVYLDGKQIFNNISKKRLKEKGDKISSPVFNNLCKIYNISNNNRDIIWKRYISNILYNLNRS